MTPDIGQLFKIIKAAADSAGDTLSPREAVDCIQAAMNDVKPMIVAWENARRIPRIKNRKDKPIPYRVTRK